MIKVQGVVWLVHSINGDAKDNGACNLETIIITPWSRLVGGLELEHTKVRRIEIYDS